MLFYDGVLFVRRNCDIFVYCDMSVQQRVDTSVRWVGQLVMSRASCWV